MATYLQQLRNDPRVDEISVETDTGDGFWVYLKKGFCNGEGRGAWDHSEAGCVHCVHEWKIKDLRAAMRDVEECDCNGCKPKTGETP